MMSGRVKLNATFILLLIVLFSCKKEKGSSIPAAGVLTTGTWYVSKMVEDTTDQTAIFNEYTFVFNTNGELTAACSYGTTVGSWYADNEDHGDSEFRIALGYTEPLSKLSKRWHVRTQTSTKVDLYDDEDSAHEELIFEKQ